MLFEQKFCIGHSLNETEAAKRRRLVGRAPCKTTRRLNNLLMSSAMDRNSESNANALEILQITTENERTRSVGRSARRGGVIVPIERLRGTARRGPSEIPNKDKLTQK